MSGIDFNIHFVTQTGEKAVHSFSVSASNSASPKLLTLRAPFPNNAARYFLRIVIDGHNYETPAAGFENIQELWEWVQDNMINLGRWYLLNNELMLTVKAVTGAIGIDVIEAVRAVFPTLQQGEFYKIYFNGSSFAPLYTRADVLVFARNTWGDYGVWLTWKDDLVFIPKEVNSTNTLKLWASSTGAFSEGFSDDFA